MTNSVAATNYIFQAFYKGAWINIPQSKKGDRSGYEAALSANLPIQILWTKSGKAKIIKNKKLVPVEPIAVAVAVAPSKKPRISVTADSNVVANVPAGRIGRPKGSKNKKQKLTMEQLGSFFALGFDKPVDPEVTSFADLILCS